MGRLQPEHVSDLGEDVTPVKLPKDWETNWAARCEDEGVHPQLCIDRY